MRIIHVNKFLHRKGGAEVYFQELAAASETLGHNVAVFGGGIYDGPMLRTEPVSIDSPDYHSAARPDQKFKHARNVLWNAQAARRLGELIADFGADLVHFHNYSHQLSNSVLAEAKARSVKTVYTAHDYKLICPAYTADRRGSDCFDCARGISRRLVTDRCLHGSVAWSSLAAVEGQLTRRGSHQPDVIIAPSRFMYERLRDSWLTAPIELVPNPIVPADGPSWAPGGDYLLYVGRVSREKGVDKLVEACLRLDAKLVIAGDGPDVDRIRALADSKAGIVTFVGHVDAGRLAQLRARSRAQVVPSTWPENAPLAALEAMGQGVPLIVSDRGGLPELTERASNVVVISTLSASTLSAALKRLPDEPPQSPKRVSGGWIEHAKRVIKTYEAIL